MLYLMLYIVYIYVYLPYDTTCKDKDITNILLNIMNHEMWSYCR